MSAWHDSKKGEGLRWRPRLGLGALLAAGVVGLGLQACGAQTSSAPTDRQVEGDEANPTGELLTDEREVSTERHPGPVPMPDCTPLTACPSGQNCGTYPDACGGTIKCGTMNGGCPVLESCNGNVCAGAACNGKTCPGADSCNLSGTCSGVLTATCAAATALPDGTSCQGADLCLMGATCQKGVCSGGTDMSCPATECTNAGSCATGTGKCTNTNKTDGTPCTGGSCTGGVCVPGSSSSSSSSSSSGASSSSSSSSSGSSGSSSGAGSTSSSSSGSASSTSSTGSSSSSTSGSTASSSGAGGASTSSSSGSTGGSVASSSSASSGGEGGSASSSSGSSDAGADAAVGEFGVLGGACNCEAAGDRAVTAPWALGLALALASARRRRVATKR